MPRWLWISLGLLIFYNMFLKEEHRSINEHQPAYTPRYEAPASFGKYTCTYDCSGHEAGYEWAEENDIDDPDDCGGNSQSFIEGCREYAEENN